MRLNTDIIATTFNTSSTSIGYGSGPFEIKVPQSNVKIPKPLSYEFRVAEFVDKSNVIIKIGLQVRIFEHDGNGEGTIVQDWNDVTRVQVPVTD